MHHHPQHHSTHVNEASRLSFALSITVVFATIEVVAGFAFNSMALLGDAGHMVSDSMSLGLAAVAAYLAQKPPSQKHTYGFARIEVLAALFNAMLMLVVVYHIAWSAVLRIINPLPVQGVGVMVVALIGLVVNIIVFMVLHNREAGLNTKAAQLHVLGDTLASIAALASGLIVMVSGWYMADPILSLLICVLLTTYAIRLLWYTFSVLLEAVPGHLRLTEVGNTMAELDGVESVHDLHIWTVTNGQVMLTAHVVVSSLNNWLQIHDAISKALKERFQIEHITLQPEPRVVSRISEQLI